jgi:DNA-binding CsgD family transcriptional regulator
MTLSLTASEVAALQSTMSLCASPFSAPSLDEWSEAVLRSCVSLLGADSALAWLPANDGNRPFGLTPYFDEAVTSYLGHFIRLDSGFTEYRRAHRLGVYSREAIAPGYARNDWRELEHEWLRPNRFLDSLGLSVDADGSPFPFLIHLYHDRQGAGRQFGDHGTQMLELIRPSLGAGLDLVQRTLGLRANLFSMFDEIPSAFMCFGVDGRCLYENRSLRDLLGLEASSSLVRAEASRLATSISTRLRTATKATAGNSALDVPRRSVATPAQRYVLSASLVPADIAGPDPVCLVTVERRSGRTLSAEELASRFRLSKREAEVAVLLASGRRNADIAAQLDISPHTAERHTERVLRKLGVSSRAAVARAIEEA